MNVLEYFDYEKQLLRDYEAVKTPHAKTAVFKTLMDTLDTHKEFVFNTISSFEENLRNAKKDVQRAQDGQTPKYVTDMMAEFGFIEAETVVECEQEDCVLDRDTYDKLVGKTPSGPRPKFAEENTPPSGQGKNRGGKRRNGKKRKTETDKVQEMLERKI